MSFLPLGFTDRAVFVVVAFASPPGPSPKPEHPSAVVIAVTTLPDPFPFLIVFTCMTSMTTCGSLRTILFLAGQSIGILLLGNLCC